MTITEATLLRDEFSKVLVGERYDIRRPDWSIKDIIISDRENAGNVYTKMYDGKMSNEMALSFFSIKEDNYDALIIADQWSPGSGDLLIESAQRYVKINSD